MFIGLNSGLRRPDIQSIQSPKTLRNLKLFVIITKRTFKNKISNDDSEKLSESFGRSKM